MAIIRCKDPKHANDELVFNVGLFDTLEEDEWKGDISIGRLEEPGWDSRYEYEAKIVVAEIKKKDKVSTFLELGSGPGMLGQKILKEYPKIDYHFVDKKYAAKYHKDNKLKGKFFVKDMALDLDTEGLEEKYDFIMANDFLEHVLSPTMIAQKMKALSHKDTTVLISVPNWRMGHQFIYKGLFDYDNFIYFMHVHGFESTALYGSNMVVGPPEQINQIYPRLDSEESLPEEYLHHWNHYIIFKPKQSDI